MDQLSNLILTFYAVIVLFIFLSLTVYHFFNYLMISIAAGVVSYLIIFCYKKILKETREINE